MSCDQLYVLRCDHAELKGALVKRCQREVLGGIHEARVDLRRRAIQSLGWVMGFNVHGDERHYCPKHVDDFQTAEAPA